MAKIALAAKAGRWEEIVELEDRMEELIETAPGDKERTLPPKIFGGAHVRLHNYAKAAKCFEREIELLGDQQRFRDQGTSMTTLVTILRQSDDFAAVRQWSTRARNLGQEHGHFQTELAPANPKPLTLNPTHRPFTLNPQP